MYRTEKRNGQDNRLQTYKHKQTGVGDFPLLIYNFLNLWSNRLMLLGVIKMILKHITAFFKILPFRKLFLHWVVHWSPPSVWTECSGVPFLNLGILCMNKLQDPHSCGEWKQETAVAVVHKHTHLLKQPIFEGSPGIFSKCCEPQNTIVEYLSRCNYWGWGERQKSF